MYFSDIFLTSDLRSPTEDITSPSSPNPSELGDSTDSLSELSTLDGDELNEELLLENRCFQELEIQNKFLQEANKEIVIQDVDVVIDALLKNSDSLDHATKKRIKQYQHEINSSQLGWAKLPIEEDLYVLAALLFEWIEGLKLPILGLNHFETIVVFYKQTEACFRKITKVNFCNENGLKFDVCYSLLTTCEPSFFSCQRRPPSNTPWTRLGITRPDNNSVDNGFYFVYGVRNIHQHQKTSQTFLIPVNR